MKDWAVQEGFEHSRVGGVGGYNNLAGVVGVAIGPGNEDITLIGFGFDGDLGVFLELAAAGDGTHSGVVHVDGDGVFLIVASEKQHRDSQCHRHKTSTSSHFDRVIG